MWPPSHGLHDGAANQPLSAPVTATSFRTRLQEVADELGGVPRLAAKSGIAERSVRNYLAGKEPKASIAVKLAHAGEVRAEWLITGQGAKKDDEITARSAAVAPYALQQPAAVYRGVLDLKALAAAIEAVEVRMPSITGAAKARLIAACYEHLAAKETHDAAAVDEFLALIAGVLQDGEKLRDGHGGDTHQEAPRRRSLKD